MDEVNPLHIPSRNFQTSYLVAPCPQVVVPASSSNTQRVIKVEGDIGGDGSASEFLEHVEMTERALRVMVPCVDDWVGFHTD